MGDQVTARALANLLGVSKKTLSELAQARDRGTCESRAVRSRSKREQLLCLSRAIAAAGEGATLTKTKSKSQQRSL
jgi:hypothetical protein